MGEFTITVRGWESLQVTLREVGKFTSQKFTKWRWENSHVDLYNYGQQVAPSRSSMLCMSLQKATEIETMTTSHDKKKTQLKCYNYITILK